MAYIISDFLPHHAILAAVRETYTPDEEGVRRNADNQCPLGRAMEAMGLEAPGPEWGRWGAPSSDEIADALNIGAAGHAAEAFIGDWDTGFITNLAAALGVEAQP